MRTVIISGFKTFGNYLANPTEIVARRLNGGVLAGFRILSVIFRAIIPKGDRGEILFRMAERFNASGIICLGMASAKTGLCIETTARNLIYNEKYCDPTQNNTPIDPHEPLGKKVTLHTLAWDVHQFLELAADRGIPVMPLSEDAGFFCCNHLMWQLNAKWLRSRRGRADTPFVFIHVPCCPESFADPVGFSTSGKGTMTINQIVMGLRLLLSRASLP